MVLTTRVTKLLNIEHPIIMGGMTGVGTPELCAAVSAAGGLGTIAAHNVGPDPEVLREWIREVRRRAPGKPFGVNFTILPSMGKPPPYEAYAKIVVEEGVKVVETAGSNPKKWVTFFKDAGCTTIHKCVSIRHALSAERLGVDVVSLDGFECAGHPGEDDIGNLVLQARGAQELKVPFVCSGGVGDGRQLAACLALGADGINCGTRFCATKECSWPESFKERLVQGKETDTVLMFRRLHNTARVFRNAIATKVESIERAKGDAIEFKDVATLVAGKRGRDAEQNGDPDGGVWTAGQVTGLINDVPSCAELIYRIVSEAESTIRSRLAGMVEDKASSKHSTAIISAEPRARL